MFEELLKDKNKISFQIMRAIILVNIISLIVVFGVLYVIFSDSVRMEALNLSESAIESKAYDLNEEFSSIESSLGVLKSTVISEIDLNRAKNEDGYLEDYCDSLANRLSNYGESSNLSYSVYVYFNHGLFERPVDAWVYRLDDGTYERQEIIGLDYYKEYREWYHIPIVERRSTWTKPYRFSYSDGKESVLTSRTEPLIVDGEIIGLVGMDLDLSELYEYLKIGSGDNETLYIISNEGDVIMHPKYSHNTYPAQEAFFNELIERIRFDEELVFEDNVEGENSVIAHKRLSNGWFVVSIVSRGQVYQLGQNMLIAISIMLFLTILISSFIARSLASRLSRPIVQIDDNIRRIGDGEFSAEIAGNLIDRKGEIGSLAESAEAMRIKLQQAFEKVQDHNERLEDEVNFRTKEIMDVNEELKASLKTLEEQQETIREMEKYELSRFLIQNMAHKLNTPISTSLMTIDYVSEEFLTMDDESLRNSLEIVSKSQVMLKDIVDGLNDLVEPYKDFSPETINLCESVKVGLFNFSHSIYEKISCPVKIDERLNVSVSPLLLYKLIQNLMELATQDMNHDDVLKVEFDSINYQGKTALVFRDFNYDVSSLGLNIFEPFKRHSFADDQRGLEYFVLYDMVVRGMKTNIIVNKDKKDYLEMIIPLEN